MPITRSQSKSLYRNFSIILDTLTITIFLGSGWPMFYEITLMLYVSARFTAMSIFHEMATGDRLRVAEIFH